MRRFRSPLLLALIVALLLRVLAAVAVESHVRSAGRSFLIAGDAEGYWELGARLARGAPYALHSPPRRVLRTPGLPLVLAGSIAVFGENILPARIVLALLGTVGCGLLWWLARLVFDVRTADVAVWIAAVSPLHVAMAPLILTETLFGVGILATLLALQRLLRQPAGISDHLQRSPAPEFGSALVTGLLFGATVLIRPGWLPWGACAAGLVLAFGPGGWKRRGFQAGMLCVGCAIVLLPWAMRNHRVTGHFVVTSLWSGPSLYDGLNPQATGASDMSFVDDDGLYASMSEFEVNAEYARRAWEFAWDSPGRTGTLAVRKAARFLSPVLSAGEVAGPLVNLVCFAWYAGFAVVLVLGLLSVRRDRKSVLLLTLPFVQILAVHMVFVGSVRYRIPVELPLIPLAARGLCDLNRLRPRHSGDR